MIKGIVDGCKGVITVKSEKDKGSTFEAYFPILETQTEKSASKSEKGAATTGNEMVLVIDDEHAIVGLIQKLLTALGYRVMAQTSPMAALALFKSDPGRFDLVITDMTGDLLAMEMKKIRPHIPVILRTGYSKRMSEEIAGASGINALLMKPVVRSELAGTVRNVLDEAKSPTQP
ncbi:MAG: response regulator [Deltaproteobacteria bacterium]|nr:response regulator [Deltaproteobacteria bacterium]